MPYQSRGWRSTKLHLSLIALALITGAYAFTGSKDTLFGEYCFAVLGAAGLYTGARTFEKRQAAPQSSGGQP